MHFIRMKNGHQALLKLIQTVNLSQYNRLFHSIQSSERLAQRKLRSWGKQEAVRVSNGLNAAEFESDMAKVIHIVDKDHHGHWFVFRNWPKIHPP